MKTAQFWNIDNVSSFRGFDVRGGEVSLGESEYIDHLNEIYGDVEVCGYTYGAGDVLESQDPTALRCGKGDYESEIQSELEDQLSREDSADIEFIEGDKYELSDDEEECVCCNGTNEKLNSEGECGTCVEWNEEESEDE